MATPTPSTRLWVVRNPLCDIPSGCCSFTGPWTVTRSSLRMLRRVAACCRPLRPVLLLVSPPPCTSTLKVRKTTVRRGPVLACDARYQKNACGKNLPIPHPNHHCCTKAPEHNVRANFSMFWTSSLPIRGIRSCGIEALSNLAPHPKQLHMLALWGWLWSRLGCRVWVGLGFLFLETKLSSTRSLVN